MTGRLTAFDMTEFNRGYQAAMAGKPISFAELPIWIEGYRKGDRKRRGLLSRR